MKEVLISGDFVKDKIGVFNAGDIVACVSDNMTGTIKIEEQFFIIRIDEDGVVELLDEESDIRYTTLGDLLLNFDKIW
jgi:hypothetical protein